MCLAVVFGLLLNAGLRAETNAVFKCQVKVVDAQGQPVSGAIIEHFGFNELSPTGLLGAATRNTTDRAGTVSFTTTNLGGGVILARKAGLAVTWGSWYPGLFADDDDVVVELALTPPTAVMGVVHDAAGKPVGGAVVWVGNALRATTDSQIPMSILPGAIARQHFSARTGADGKFRIDGLPGDAKLQLGVTKPGLALDRPHESSGLFNPFNADIEAGQSNITLVLKPAGAIEGTAVQVEGGASVPGARVTLANAEIQDEPGVEAPPVAIADAKGVFRFADLAPGEYQLQAQLGTNPPPELVGEPTTVTVATGATNREAKLSLSRGGLLEVTVKDATDEKPIAGAMVYANFPGLTGPAKPITTSAKGIAVFRLPPGNYQVFASKGTTTASGGQATVELHQTNRTSLSLTAPGATTTLSGTVVDTAGQPVPKATVLLFPFARGEKKADAHGRFELKSNPNQFGGGANFQRVIIARDLGRNLAAAVDVEEETTNAKVQLKPGLTLVGRVTTPDGKPITNAQATVQLWSGQMASQMGSPAKADGRGVFEIKGLPAGRKYGLNVSANGFGQDSRTVEETDTDTNRLELESFQLAPANLRVVGVVLDADDKPAASAMVNGFGEKQPQVNGRADAKGRFAFEHVSAGAIHLSANDLRGGRFGNISAEGGDTNVTIHLGSQMANFGGRSAASEAKLSGTVLDPEGKPAPKVPVSLFPDYSNTHKNTDEAGHFVLSANANQFGGGDNRRVLIARDVGRNLAAAIELDSDATNADVKLEPGLTLAGRVTGPDGKPIANAEATLMFWTASMGTSYGSPARADAQGHFEIKALPPGRHYGVSVSAKGFGQDSKDLAAAETGVTRLDLEPFQLALANLRVAGVVLDADDKPVARAFVNTFGGQKQPALNCQADAKGRFSFDHVCAGAINLSANGPNGGENGSVSAEGGDTNITIHLGSQEADFGGGGRESTVKFWMPTASRRPRSRSASSRTSRTPRKRPMKPVGSTCCSIPTASVVVTISRA